MKASALVQGARSYVAPFLSVLSILLASCPQVGLCQFAGSKNLTADSSVTRGSVDTSGSFSTGRFILASIPPAAMLGAAIYQNWDTYWKHDGHVAFHVVSEPAYALQNDKLGHMFYTSLSADVICMSYNVAGLDRATAVWLGSSLSLLAELLVEVEDGMHPSSGPGGADYYGFSPGDAVSDLIGASLPLGRHYYPPLSNLDFKISMWPSEALRRHVYQSIVDDDESHFYWLSLDVHRALDIEYWPEWLNVCAGYSVEKLEAGRYAFPDVSDYRPEAAVFVGLDLNLKGLPIHGDVWDTLTNLFSHFKIPLPALQLAPRVQFWGLR